MPKDAGLGGNTLYRPLLPGQIRVVLIATGEESDPFDLEVLETNIQPQPEASTMPYVTLSYTRGGDRQSFPCSPKPLRGAELRD
jgi:hypothetical protein